MVPIFMKLAVGGGVRGDSGANTQTGETLGLAVQSKHSSVQSQQVLTPFTRCAFRSATRNRREDWKNEPPQSHSNSPGSERRLLLPRVWVTHPNRGPAGLLHSSGKTEDGFRNTQLPDVPLNVQQLPLGHILIRKKPRQHFLLTPLN